MKNRLTLLTVAIASISFIVNIACTANPAKAEGRTWSDEDLAGAFDEVARNFGAIEYAAYTYMVEFNRVPESLDDLISTGHLNVEMTNPYTSGDVLSLTREDVPDGDLAGNVLMYSADEGREVHVETWMVRNDEGYGLYTRSMIKRIYIFSNEITYNYIFENELSRDEQLTAVYCVQAMDAIESFAQRNGVSPVDFADMYENGDVNVHYINPFTGMLAISSETLSPGDYFYEKFGDEGYTIMGWGNAEPVFFATTEESEEVLFYEKYPSLAPDEITPQAE